MSKTVKITPAYECREDVMNVWGVQFVKQEDGQHVGEVDEKLAKEMIKLKRAAEYKPATKTATKTTVNFASDEAGELNATLVADKTLTKAEFKKIEGTGTDGAITVGDINDYVASKKPKTPVKPPAPSAVK